MIRRPVSVAPGEADLRYELVRDERLAHDGASAEDRIDHVRGYTRLVEDSDDARRT